MAIVRSLEGTFYDIPDSELEQYKVPADQVKSIMEAAGQKPPPHPTMQFGPQTPGRPAGGSPQILVQFITQAPCPPRPTQGQAEPAEGEEEKVEPQWYWVNWANWANWYNWY